jgi:hypothetical protein
MNKSTIYLSLEHAFIYPILLVETAHDLEVLVTTEKLNGFETVEELVVAVKGSVGSASLQ